MQFLLSFIIPAYNIATKVERCLRSIARLALPKEEMEVVVIDDASMDDTAEVCERLLTKLGLPHTVTVQPKGGQATGRNRGLAMAQGEYVWMVDGDDEIIAENIPINKLLRQEQKYDLIAFNYDEIYPERTNHFMLHEKEVVVTGIDYLEQFNRGSYLWNKIYRREAIKDVHFIDGLTHIEDMCFNMHALAQIQHVLCLPYIGYRYYRYPKRKLEGEAYLAERRKANEDTLAVYRSLITLRDKGDSRLRKMLDEEIRFDVIAHLYYLFRFDSTEDMKRYISIYRELGVYPLKRCNNRKANQFRLLANHPRLLCLAKRFAKQGSLYPNKK